MSTTSASHPHISITQGDRSFWLTKISAKDIVHISYVARRGETTEVGAVQRFLSPKRISKISEFALQGGDFPSCIILNWVNRDYPIKATTKSLTIPRRRQSAQIIDGQHRVAGLEEAIQKNSKIGRLELPVAIYNNLETKACADLFLSINTEQKPVQRSLVFDLYGEASEFIVDPAAARAKDIAQTLRDSEESPYFEYIKFPGSKRGDKGIALSTVVSALKPLVEEKGAFEQIGVSELNMQETILLNYLRTLHSAYGDMWDDKENALLYAAGFTGAIEFFKNKMLTYCNLREDFTQSCMAKALPITKDDLIMREEIKNLQGRKAFTTVSELLESAFNPVTPQRKVKL